MIDVLRMSFEEVGEYGHSSFYAVKREGRLRGSMLDSVIGDRKLALKLLFCASKSKRSRGRTNERTNEKKENIAE